MKIHEFKTKKDIIEIMRKDVIQLAIICVDSDHLKWFQYYKRIIESKLCDRSTRKNVPVFFLGEENDIIGIKQYDSIKDVIYFKQPFEPNLLFYYFLDALGIEKDEYLSSEEQERLAKIEVDKYGHVSKKTKKDEEKEKAKEEKNENITALDKGLMEELNELDVEDIEKELTMERRKDILIIDDDLKVLKLLSTYLENDYNVVIAKSGSSALKYLKKNTPDLILLDYMMPNETGAEVFREIRFLSNSKTTPILFLTGVADAAIVKEILTLKPQGYILKPVTKDDLLSKIKPFL